MAQTLLVEDVFDPTKGWAFSPDQVPIRKVVTPGGNPNFWVTVDGVEILVAQRSEWKQGHECRVSPHRICLMTVLRDITITNALALLDSNGRTCGLPSFAYDQTTKEVLLTTAFPVGPQFPLAFARGQILTCMGQLAIDTKDVLQRFPNSLQVRRDAKGILGGIFGTNQAPEHEAWNTANEVANVAGTFLGALLGLRS